MVNSNPARASEATTPITTKKPVAAKAERTNRYSTFRPARRRLVCPRSAATTFSPIASLSFFVSGPAVSAPGLRDAIVTETALATALCTLRETKDSSNERACIARNACVGESVSLLFFTCGGVSWASVPTEGTASELVSDEASVSTWRFVSSRAAPLVRGDRVVPCKRNERATPFSFDHKSARNAPARDTPDVLARTPCARAKHRWVPRVWRAKRVEASFRDEARAMARSGRARSSPRWAT